MAALHRQIVLLGDSLFQNATETLDGFSFQAALQSKFIRRLDVVNRGYSGYNTDHVIKLITDIFPERDENGAKIDYIAILLGANDAVMDKPEFGQNVPLDRYKDNLNKIINHPRIQAHKPKILLVTPPPLDELKATPKAIAWGLPRSPRTAAISAEYSEAAREVARQNPDVVLVDLYTAFINKAIDLAPYDYKENGPLPGTPENGKPGGLDILLNDGLHLSGEGYKVFFDLIVPYIGKEWQGLAIDDRTGYKLPDWRDLVAEK